MQFTIHVLFVNLKQANMDYEQSDDVTFKIYQTPAKPDTSAISVSRQSSVSSITNSKTWIVNKDVDQSGRFTFFQEFRDPDDKGRAEEFLADPVAYYENLRQSDDVKVFISCALFVAIVLAVFVLMFTINPAM